MLDFNSRLQENSDRMTSLYRAKVASDGQVEWQVPVVLRVSCQMDAHHYPWDEQTCNVKFGSWTFDYSSVDMAVEKDVGGTLFYIESGEWDLKEYTFKHNLVYYPCCKEPYSDVTATIKVRRKPFYVFFHLILPAFLISLMSSFVFYLPPDSGEKVTLSVTGLLALILLLLLVADSVPPTDSIPLIGKLLYQIYNISHM